MPSQVLKFLAILNLCFWLTLTARYTKVLDQLPVSLVSLVAVLGFSAIGFNVIYLIFNWLSRPHAKSVLDFYQLFIVLSLIAQVIIFIPPLL